MAAHAPNILVHAEAEGLSRSQWFRRRQQLAVTQDAGHATTHGRNNSVKAESIPVASVQVDRLEGFHGRGGYVGRAGSDQVGGEESLAPCPSALSHNLSHENPQSIVPKNLRAVLETNSRTETGSTT
jgi:hypothetical protein